MTSYLTSAADRVISCESVVSVTAAIMTSYLTSAADEEAVLHS